MYNSEQLEYVLVDALEGIQALLRSDRCVLKLTRLVMVGQNGTAYKYENLQGIKVAAGGGSSEAQAARYMWYFFDFAYFGKSVRNFGPILRTQNLLVISRELRP
jgi:hypothetical protein